MDRRGVVDRGRKAREGRKTKWEARKLNLAVACLAALGMLAVGAGAASAAGTYKYLCPGPAICGAGYSLPFGLAVDNSGGATAGDVYVANLTNGAVFRFTATGDEAPFTGANTNIAGSHLTGFTFPTSVAVDSSGNFYVGDRTGSGNVIDKFTSSGEPVTTFALPAGITSITGLAVDNSGGSSNGDIYASDETTNSVTKLSGAGAVLATITGGLGHEVKSPYNVAVDTHGHVYITNFREKVQRFSESGTFESELDTNHSQAVAVDPSTEDIFVSTGEGSFIQPYTAAGVALTPFGEAAQLGGFNAGMGVGVGSHHFVYVTSLLNNAVAMYGIGEPPTEPTTESATEITGTTAVLHGTVPIGGETGATGYHFEYNTGGTCTGGSSTPTASVTEAAVQAEITGLTPTTEYTFCVVATNAFGPTPGGPLTATTIAAAPTITEEQAVPPITTTTAPLTATINPGGAATTCEVQYGETIAYGLTAPCSVAGNGVSGVPVTAELTGLAANTEYHFRFVATNEIATTEGIDATVKTKPLVECETGEANPVTSSTANIHGHVKTGLEAATYYVEYGETTAYGLTTEVKEVPAGQEGSHPVEIEAKNLAPGTLYHYRYVCSPASEPSLKITGEDEELTTPPTKPVIEEEFSENEGRHSVSLGAEINPENSETTYFFEYGKTATYSSKTSGGSLPKGLAPEEAGPEAVTELEPGTTYHYRVVATNSAGTVEGPDETFTTTAPKLAIVEAESSAQVTQTTATISGTINPNGLQTSYIVEVGTEVEGHIVYTPSFGEVGSGAEGVGLAFALSNLLPGTTYHYRFVAQNEDGTTFGADQTFITGLFAPVITTPGPVQIIPTPPQPKEEKVTVRHGETRVEMYKHAVKLCKKKPKSKRAACMRRAKKNFGPVKKKGKKK